MGEVEVDCPVEMARRDECSVQFKLYSVVQYASHIGRNGACSDTGRTRDLLVVKQVNCLAVEIFYGTAEPVPEEREIEPGIESIRSLPRDVLVTLVIHRLGIFPGRLGISHSVLVGVRLVVGSPA